MVSFVFFVMDTKLQSKIKIDSIMSQLNLNNSMVSSANGHYLIVFILLEKFLTFTRPPKSHQTICTRFILTSVQSLFH